MRRIGLGFVLAIGLFIAPFVAEAQMPSSRTIGFLGPPPSSGGLLQAFQQSLRDLGYIEGQNIRIEYRYTDVALQGHAELFPQLAAELVQLKPDVLVVSVTEAALAAKNATSTIPIVMVSVPDPVAAGLVTSLARPGGNVTGLSRQTRDIVGKDLQLLKEVFPEIVRVGVLGNLTEPLNAAMVSDAKEAAKVLGVQLKILEAGAPSQLEGAFSVLQAERVGAVLVLGGAGFYLNRTRIADLALRSRLPSMFQNHEFVEVGGLLAYAPSTVANDPVVRSPQSRNVARQNARALAMKSRCGQRCASATSGARRLRTRTTASPIRRMGTSRSTLGVRLSASIAILNHRLLKSVYVRWPGGKSSTTPTTE
jgi:putative ABC transport system substrate-binding protein